MSLESDEDVFEWPTEQAERVKLFLPKDGDPYQQKSPPEQRTCVFRFDGDRRLLAVQFDGDTEESAIDIIDPKDIIGANVEIKLMDPGSVVSSTRDPDSDILSQVHEQGRSSPTNIQSPADNEPVSAVPFDTQAVAVLSLYVYPKRPTGAKKSILRFCGADRARSKTSKGDIICEEGMDRYRDNFDETNSKNVGSRYGHHRRFTVAPVEDFTDLSIMVNAIRKLSRSIPSSETDVTTKDEERILVIANPCSGTKKGVHIYDTTVRPMLEQAGIAHDCLITTHEKHAEERMKKQSSTSDFRDISEYSGIVLVGGDGCIHEAMQGIHQRDDRDKILERLKLGAIGAGTSNGFSASLAHASKVCVYIRVSLTINHLSARSDSHKLC